MRAAVPGAPGDAEVSPRTARRLGRLRCRDLPDGLALREARSPRARMLGLARLDDMPADEALLIPRCGSVHTFGMRFPIDVIFLDRRGELLSVRREVRPRRFVGARRAKSVVETRAGLADRFLAAGVATPAR